MIKDNMLYYMEEYNVMQPEAIELMKLEQLEKIVAELKKMNSSEYADGLAQTIAEALKE